MGSGDTQEQALLDPDLDKASATNAAAEVDQDRRDGVTDPPDGIQIFDNFEAEIINQGPA